MQTNAKLWHAPGPHRWDCLNGGSYDYQGVGREEARRLCRPWKRRWGQQAADDAGRHPRDREKSTSICAPIHVSALQMGLCLPGIDLHVCCQACSECNHQCCVTIRKTGIRILRKLPASLRFYGPSTRTCIRAFACIATMACRQIGLDMGSVYSRGCRSRIPRNGLQL